MNELPSVEANIITAAIDCIEKYGILGATNRKIAQAAGVNNAAINYYFRSKDQLIQRCMQVTLENAFDFKDFARLPGASARERCAAIFDELIAGGIQYPGITRAHFYGMFNEGKYDSLAVEKLNDFVRHLAQDLAERGAGLEPDELQLACAQITMTVLMAILAPKLFQASFGLDLGDALARQRFVTRLVERLLSYEKI
jgi:AcrR family transcriptional regulator